MEGRALDLVGQTVEDPCKGTRQSLENQDGQ